MNKKVVITIVIVLVAAAAIVGGYLWYNNRSKPDQLENAVEKGASINTKEALKTITTENK